MIELYCQHCGQRMEIADQYAGQSGTCKNCGKQIVVPASEPVSAFKQIPQAQTAAVPYKWIAAGTAIVVVLSLGIYMLVSRDTPVPSSRDAPVASSRNASTPLTLSPQGTTVGRIVEFPSGTPSGLFLVRDKGKKLPDRGHVALWGERKGYARGRKAVPEGKLAGVYIGPMHPAGVSFLKDFAPNDLDYLILDQPTTTDEELRNLAHLTGLRYLQVHTCGIGDAGVRHLSGLTQIEDLWLHTTNITDGSIDSLLGMKDLKGLHIFATKVTDVGIRRLKAFSSLEYLTLSNYQLTATTVDTLKDFPSLKTLGIGYGGPPDANYLPGGERPTSPDSILLLREIPQLQDLILWGPYHGNSLLPALAQLAGLKSLILGGTTITPAGIDELRRALPNCQITQSD